MLKKQLFLIIGVLVAISIVAILVIKFIFKTPIFSPVNESTNISQPPTTTVIPESLTKGQEIWSGTLNLIEPPTLTVGDKVYTLKILEKNTLSIFEGKGYKTGDTVNVMGSLDGMVINVSGLNKLVK
ncbi:MAG: hypothetical protein NTU97_04120 [Candidatus Magasanikbacteria bacterium]|nr:hypothetical protein [Candidatus Magasanikbacteria bacterium]